jgi:hypothetical protein
MIQLPSRDCLDWDAMELRVESLELERREGKSVATGDDTNVPGSSASVLVEESRESSKGAVGCRSSKASCWSNLVIGVGLTNDGG